MSAETLRRAAALMRECAEVGPDHPWSLDSGDQVIARYSLGEIVIADYVRDEWAEHIASWHPAVALAVADWLDVTAQCMDKGCDLHGTNAPLAVARAYLGEPPP